MKPQLHEFYITRKCTKMEYFTVMAESMEEAKYEEDARLQFQNGNYQYYDVSDFTEGHQLIEVVEVGIDE